MSLSLRDKENAKLNAAVGYGWNFMRAHNRPTFIDEVRPDFTYVCSYYDPQDGLPVIVIKVKVNEVTRNHRGEMHAGAYCLLVDNVTTYSVLTDMSFYDFPSDNVSEVEFNESARRIPSQMGISRTIKTHRNRPIIPGTTIYMATKTVENTPVSSFFTCMTFSEDGHLLASGQHDKTKLTKPVKPKI